MRSVFWSPLRNFLESFSENFSTDALGTTTRDATYYARRYVILSALLRTTPLILSALILSALILSALLRTTPLILSALLRTTPLILSVLLRPTPVILSALLHVVTGPVPQEEQSREFCKPLLSGQLLPPKE